MKSILNPVVALIMVFTCCACSKEKATEGYITTRDDVQLYYSVTGAGPDTVVVPAACYLSGELERLGSEKRTFIFYDQRNRGRSMTIKEPDALGMEFDISDLEEVRSHFNIKSMSLIGWSYLSAIVTQYATRHPEQVDRIIQIGPWPMRKRPYFVQTIEALNSRLDSIRSIEGGARRSSLPTKADGDVYAAIMAKPELLRDFRSDYQNLANESPENIGFTVSRICDSAGDWDWRNQMSNLLMPALIIHGEKDLSPVLAVEEWAGVLPNARLLRIPDSGHLPFLERPDLFYPAVEQFLNGEWPSEAIKVATDGH